MRTILFLAALTLAAAFASQAKAVGDPDNAGFDLVDPTGRGYVTIEEYMAPFVDKSKAAADFALIDANRDGFVTRDEFMAAQPGLPR